MCEIKQLKKKNSFNSFKSFSAILEINLGIKYGLLSNVFNKNDKK